ncbi:MULTISPECIES: hypothetical protein [unclassified Bradyrhizobium]|uniref:hypothetical protein n=1 Tax=unclassified Bradyrhizobium TaxID=2631580 RepID=UPI001BABABB1|nr:MULTISPECIES: hypothetical protein [unclassified Bradyrhizobium]MBR1207531.1 hypothetical protein [Bradyrhizobium sp. AUGA SZCCT0124]MBR1315947.1 hypothetical protein [Bradyrhizobium sp. AUGA SZCCT0051]MBR1344053.1 hypothetical protein [Bradyrhizobium sp. AUGA SZCCT0105]MBR1357960.1 hypothetical protein [Bradyrhizobium sp. AUGA SZCCT0045]
MDDPALEYALDRHGLAFGHQAGTFSARSEVDQRPTAAVVDDELVAENLGDAAAHRGWTSRLQRIDGGRLQQHDAARLPILGESHPTRAAGSTDGEYGECCTCQQGSMPRLSARRGRWGGIWM